MASSANDGIPIFIGPWINWSLGKYQGAVLTLTQRDGSLLTAFLAIFIAYAGSQLWRILCFTLSQILSNGSGPQDGLYHQRQALLRNTPNGCAGLWSSLTMLWAWRSRAQRPWTRLLPLIVTCACYWIGFSAASILSSKISTFAGDEVLISSSSCGQPGGEMYLQELYRGFDGGHPFSTVLSAMHRSRLEMSRQYAVNCYEGAAFDRQAGPSCNVFVKPKLNLTINWNASCPADLCVTENENILVEVKINSHDDLGLNTPHSERVDFIWTTHCAPLNSEGLSEEYNITTSSSTDTYLKYKFGERHYADGSGIDYTAIGKIYKVDQWEQVQSSSFVSPSLSVSQSHPINGTVINDHSFWKPIQNLQNPNSDMSLFQLTHNQLLTFGPSDDPWYSAHDLVQGVNVDGTDAYAADEAISFIYCKEQFKVCGIDEENRRTCSDPATISDIYKDEVTGNSNRANMFRRVFQSAAIHSMSQVAAWSGISSLYDDLSAVVVGAKSNGYWKLDVVFWVEQFLASIQGSMVDAATGPDDVDDSENMWHVANSTDESRYCLSQKIRSPAHTNFSILWLSIILTVGCLAIVTQWVLEQFVTWINKRTQNPRQRYALAEWKAHETFQLHRRIHEDMASGTWSSAGNGVPVTIFGEKLASFQTADLDCPRLEVSGAKASLHSSESSITHVPGKTR